MEVSGMPHRTAVVILLTSVLLASTPLCAASFRNAPARPLLVMTTHARTTGDVNTQIPSHDHLNSLFLFADRTLIQSFNRAPILFNVDVQISSHTRGRLTVSDWNALVAAMIAARIDTHQDCRIILVGLPAVSPVSEIVIRWYGRRGRKNAFEISQGAESGPPCDFDVIQLLSAIGNATAKVAAAAGSEYFSVP
jgi:hypothetical protein